MKRRRQEAEGFSPIIKQPESAKLGVNAMEQLYLDEGAVKSKPVMKRSLTADHRAAQTPPLRVTATLKPAGS